MAALELSPAVCSILGGLIEEKVGLHYGLSDRELLQERVSPRATDAGFDSLLDYYYFLRYDPAGGQELEALVETLVVNETYLFREWRAIEVLIESFIKPWCAQGKRPRIWSAACATGEEPLSLAMLLDDHGLLDQVRIVASDISARALSRAREGRYGRRSVRHIPAQRLFDRYIRGEEDQYTVSRQLIDRIEWKRQNLLADAPPSEPTVFDVILCRNVLIYFSDATVKNVLDRLARALAPDGVLLVGVSESLMRYGTIFQGEEHGGAFVYRKGRGP